MNDQQQAASSGGFQLTRFQRNSILFVCFFLYMINFMDRQVLSAVLEPMKLDLGLTDTQAGMLQSFFFLSMAVLAFPAAYLVDRWSRRKTLGIMAIIWSVFTYVTGLGKSFIGVILPRILVGVGEAGFPPAATAMISAAYPQQARARVLGIFNAAIPLGAALGTIMGGVLAGRYDNWRVPFYIFAVPGIIFGILAFFLKDYKTVTEVDESGQKKKFLANIGSLFKIPTLRWMYLGYAMQLAMTMAFIAWGPAFVMRAQGLSVARAGALMGGFGLMGLIGAPLGGIIADLWQKKNPRGRIYTPLAAAFASAVFLSLTIYFEFTGPGFLFGLLTGVTIVMGTPAVNSISQDVVTPGLKGISWGMAGFIAMLVGASWAPSAVGAISDSLGGGAPGLKFALMLMAVCGILAGVLFIFAAKPYPTDMDKVEGISLEAE
jgi:MFS family permease